MTTEEIKKIAEEYAVIPSSLFSKEYYRRLGEANSVLEFLAEHYYLVEKGKVEHEMINANRNIDLYKTYPKVKYANEGVKRVLTKLFGPDIRKEEDI